MADQDAAANAGDFGADIKHEVVAITEVDVGVATTKKHGAIASSGTAKVVRCRIALWVSFGFHYATAKAKGRKVPDDNFANKEARQGDSVRRQFGAAQAADGQSKFAGVSSRQARQSSGAVAKSNLKPDQVPRPPA